MARRWTAKAGDDDELLSDAELYERMKRGQAKTRKELADRAAATPTAKGAAATPTAKTDIERLDELRAKTKQLDAASRLLLRGELPHQLFQGMPQQPAAARAAPPPPRNIDLSILPIIWGYQDDKWGYGETYGKKVGSVAKWVSHRMESNRHNISSISTAEDHKPIRIEFIQDIGGFKKNHSIQLDNKNRVIQFINENYAGMVGGGKRRRRKSHKRKSHRRKSHKRKSHKRKRTRRRH